MGLLSIWFLTKQFRNHGPDWFSTLQKASRAESCSTRRPSTEFWHEFYSDTKFPVESLNFTTLEFRELCAWAFKSYKNQNLHWWIVWSRHVRFKPILAHGAQHPCLVFILLGHWKNFHFSYMCQAHVHWWYRLLKLQKYPLASCVLD